MDVPRKGALDLAWVDRLLLDPPDPDAPPVPLWTHYSAVVKKYGCFAGIPLASVVDEVFAWLAKEPTRQDLQSRRLVVFSALTQAAQLGDYVLFEQLERKIYKHYQKTDEVIFLQARVTVYQNANRISQLIVALSELAQSEKVKDTTRWNAIGTLIDHGAVEEVVNIVESHGDRLSAEQLDNIFYQCLSQINPKTQWTVASKLTTGTSRAACAVDRCAFLLQRFSIYLSVDDRIDFVVRVLPRTDGDLPTVELIRLALANVGRLAHRPKSLRDRMASQIERCFRSEEFAVAWDLLYLGLKTSIFSTRNGLPKIDISGLVSRQMTVQSLAETESLLSELSAIDHQDPLLWELWLAQHADRQTAEKLQALASASKILSAVTISSTAHQWALNCLALTEPDVESATALLQSAHVDHSIPAVRDIQRRLVARLYGIDRDVLHTDLWKCLWSLDEQERTGDPLIATPQCNRIFKRLLERGEDREAVRLGIRTIGDPRRVLSDLSIPIFVAWRELNDGVFARVCELDLLSSLADEFDPAGLIIGSTQPATVRHKRFFWLLQFATDVLTLANRVDDAEERHSLYTLLHKAKICDAFILQFPLLETKRIAFALSCAQLIINNHDLMVAEMFFASLLKIQPTLAPAALEKSAWIAVNPGDTQVIEEATWILIKAALATKDRRFDRQLVLAQGLLSTCSEEHWSLDVAFQLRHSSLSEARLSALTIALRLVIEGGLDADKPDGDLRDISYLMQVVAEAVVVDGSQKSPQLLLPIADALDLAVDNESLLAYEREAMMISSLVSQSDFVRTPAEQSTKLASIVELATALCDQKQEAKLLVLCNDEVVIREADIAGDALKSHAIYQLMRTLSQICLSNANKHRDVQFLVQAVPYLDRLSFLTLSDPVVHPFCGSAILQVLYERLQHVKSRADYAQILKLLLPRIRYAITWWTRASALNVKLDCAHKAISSLILTTEYCAFDSRLRHPDPERLAELQRIFSELEVLWSRLDWPLVEGSLALLSTRIVLANQAEAALGGLTQVPGIPLLLVQAVTRFLRTRYSDDWLSGDEKTDASQLETLVWITREVFSSCSWVPQPLLIELGSAFLKFVCEFSNRYGKHAEAMDLWWNTVNREERLLQLNADRLTASQMAILAKAGGSIACQVRFGAAADPSLSVRDVCALPFHLYRRCAVDAVKRFGMRKELVRLLQDYLSKNVDGSSFDNIFSSSDKHWLVTEHRGKVVSAIETLKKSLRK